MRFRRTVWVHFMALFLLIATVHAQDITGNWDGLLGGGRFRVNLQISKDADGKLQGDLRRIDQSPHTGPVTTLSFVSPSLTVTIDALGLSYEGTLSTDGKTITGTLTTGQDAPLIWYRDSSETEWKPEVLPHTVQMVPVEEGVSLEVLDWGGTGRPLVLLAGLGDTAHVFDTFASKLTGNYHVYGITRRGRGASTAPKPNTTNYTADRLGEDVLAVINALHLDKPVIAGHSMAGEELSYIGSHYSEKVAGLVYMEAGYPYALYDQANGALDLDAIELRSQLLQFAKGSEAQPVKDYDNLLANLERVEVEVKKQQHNTRTVPPLPVSPRMTPDLFAIMAGRERFTTIHGPALVIVGTDPDPVNGDDPQAHAEAVRQSLQMRDKELQIAAWKRQIPSAHMLLIPHSTHYVFQSNEVDVLHGINNFIATLPPAK